jgi:NTE family protein
MASNPHKQLPPHCTKVGLVLQGGGALGAYQAGVYATLAEFGYEPDWISGVSIGAVNGAIIAGNPVERRAAQNLMGDGDRRPAGQAVPGR